MSLIPDNFHFLRPEWLLALVPAMALAVYFWNGRLQGTSSGWTRYVDPHLLSHLSLRGGRARRNRLTIPLGFIAVSLVIVGLSGPSWQKSDVPSFTGGQPIVAVLSLAQSMNADDLTPSRLKRSVHKLKDILARTQGDERGLVIYSDVPFVAAPLTNDPLVIEQMLPELSTSLMPVLGNRLDLAIAEAQQVLIRADATAGRVIVIADDAGDNLVASLAAAKALNEAGYELSVLGVGTEEGATLQTADGRAISASDGRTFMTKLDENKLQDLADTGGGIFTMITAGDSDLDRLLPDTGATTHTAGAANDFQADGWVDMGYWLLILPVLLVPFIFRRGMIMGLVVIAGGLVIQPPSASASQWDDLWSTKDQQAQVAFQNGAFDTAAHMFETPDWQASAAYRAGDYNAAAASYAATQRTDKDYNLGNALARSGDLEGALAAYERALELNTNDEDARFNRDLVEALLKQQQEQQDQQDQQQSQNGQSGEQDQQDQQQSQNGQSGDQDQQDQQQSQNGQSGDQDQQDQQQSQNGQSGEQDQQDQQQSQNGQSGDQDQQDQQQSQNGQSGDQDQQDQQQSQNGQSGEQGQQDQQQSQNGQSGEQGQQDQQQSQNGQNDAQQQQAQQQEPGQTADPGATEQNAEAGPQSESNALSRLLSEALTGNGNESQEPAEAQAAEVSGPVNQAVEQQLRRVPDDPTGLLRARIRQHYARLSAAQ